MMGKLTLAFSILFVSTFSFGQKKQKKNELSFSTFKASTNAFYDYSAEPVMLNLGANVIYKRSIYDNFYFRASQSYYQYSMNDYGYYCFDCAENERNIQEINTSSGFEFRYFRTNSGKFVLHSGFDASLFIHKNKHTSQFGDLMVGSYAYYKKNTGLGIQAFSGMSIYPTKKLVLSMEGSLLIGFCKAKYGSTDRNGFTPPTIEDGNWEPYAQLFLIRTASIGWRF